MLYEKLKNPIVIICGHYGAGKTNVAVNLAKAAAAAGRNVTLADFDMVNPYFRAADNKRELEAVGIRVIAPIYANTNVDIATPPQGFRAALESGDFCVIDVGGDDGALALAAYRADFEKRGYDMLYVYNKYRPLTAETGDAAESAAYIASLSGLNISGIVNNSNIGAETTPKTVLESLKAGEELAKATGIPLLCVCAEEKTAEALGIDAFGIENATKRLF